MDWEEKFVASGQAALKLDIALERLLPDGEPSKSSPLTPYWEQTYRDYLSARTYPALQRLIEQGNARRLRHFLALGVASREQCRRVLEQSGTKQAEIRLMLMGMEQEHPPQVSLTAEEAADQAWRLMGQVLAQEIPYLELFFLDFSVNVLTNTLPGYLQTGTDGLQIYLHAPYVLQCFRENSLKELYLHIMLHILYGHVLQKPEYPRNLWDMACDVSAWKLRREVFDFPLSLENGEKDLERLLQIFPDSLEVEEPAVVYRYLIEHPRQRQQAYEMLKRLPGDTHDYWYGKNFQTTAMVSGQEEACGSGQTGAYKERADYLARIQKKLAQAETFLKQRASMPKARRFGLAPGSRRELLELREQGKYDFGRYLKRFAYVREELQTDEDSFDYIYYMLGLERYGNMPLIEPLEYMEAQRVEELVIAIDTSGSCSVEVVRRFLEETRNLLTQKENFFRRMNVHIIQCDSIIQQHQVITSVEDWQRYERELTVEGRGGTDFTTVFRFVEKLRQSGALKKLKGLLYFTDGDGIYPREPTDYETVFVFARREFLEGNKAGRVPKWAVKLCLDLPEEGKR